MGLIIRISEAAYRGWTGVVDLHLVVDNISVPMKVPNVHPKQYTRSLLSPVLKSVAHTVQDTVSGKIS